jgi:hypothetical protein
MLQLIPQLELSFSVVPLLIGPLPIAIFTSVIVLIGFILPRFKSSQMLGKIKPISTITLVKIAIGKGPIKRGTTGIVSAISIVLGSLLGLIMGFGLLQLMLQLIPQLELSFSVVPLLIIEESIAA